MSEMAWDFYTNKDVWMILFAALIGVNILIGIGLLGKRLILKLEAKSIENAELKKEEES